MGALVDDGQPTGRLVARMAARPGVVGEAHDGTLFLDEIGEMPHSVQAHLLRVLDDGENNMAETFAPVVARLAGR